MTRENFLKLKIPNLPYYAFHLDNICRTISSEYYETIHFKNVKKNWQINIWWSKCNLTGNKNMSDIGAVTVSYYDKNEKNPFKKSHELNESDKHFTQEKLTQLIKEILK